MFVLSVSSFECAHMQKQYSRAEAQGEQAVLEPKQVLVAGRVQDSGGIAAAEEDPLVHVQVDVNVIDAAQVGTSRGLGILWLDGERPVVDELAGHVGVHQPRHHEAEELRGAGSDTGVVVELDVHVLDGVQDGVGHGVIVPAEVEPVVAALGFLAADGNEELGHDVVEDDPLRHHLGGGGLGGRRHRFGDGLLLVLGAGDALLELAVGELGALVLVQVHAERLDLHI